MPEISRVVWPKSSNSKSLKAVRDAWKKLKVRKDLGFLNLPENQENWETSVAFARKLSKFEKLKVLGMGGSGLGGRMLIDALSPKANAIEFIFDSHPQVLANALTSGTDAKTGWLVISKSGGTIETITQLMAVLEVLKQKKLKASDQIFVITENKSSILKDWAEAYKVEILAHPLDVGGRFSVLSPVGLVPAHWAGLNLKALQKGAARALSDVDGILHFAATSLESFKNGENISVFWSYCYHLNSFMPWAQQLWAESLGKSPKVKVSTPLPSYGTCDQHSVLQQYMEGAADKHVFIFRDQSVRESGAILNSKGFGGFEYLNGKTLGEIYLAEAIATERALKKAKRSVSVIEFEELTPEILGELIVGFEITIGILGEALKINAFNQPGVEAGKVIAQKLLKDGF